MLWSSVAADLRVLSESCVEGSLAVRWLVHDTESAGVLGDVGVSAASVIIVDHWLGVNLGE